MENIKINTTQNVALSYTAAGVGPRMLAIFLDLIFKYSYYLVIYLVFIYTARQNTYGNNYFRGENNEFIIGLFILFLLPALLYHLLCETFLNGQSFGKKILKIKVVKLDGTQPNFGSYLVRSMFRLVDDSIVGLVAIAVSKNSQRIGDMLAGTTVIALNKKLTLADTILHQQKEDYKIVYSQVALLSDTDANTIKEVLSFSRQEDQPEHLALLAKKIKEKYGISDVKQSNEEFLKTLLMDYSHYQFER